MAPDLKSRDYGGKRRKEACEDSTSTCIEGMGEGKTRRRKETREDRYE